MTQCKSIRFVRDNWHILDKFYYENFNLLSITLDLPGITCTNPIYNEKKFLANNFIAY